MLLWLYTEHLYTLNLLDLFMKLLNIIESISFNIVFVFFFLFVMVENHMLRMRKQSWKF